jgi:membrane protein implicated in regulation of membrane protease activity
MSALLDTAAPYAWWIVGLALLVLEVVIPGVYLLFPGIAALIVGAVVLIVGKVSWFAWEQQVLAFVVLSTVAVVAGRQWYGPKTVGKDRPQLNNRADRLVGRVAVLSEPIVGGSGKVAIEDGWWLVDGPDMPAGTRVRITAASGSVLTVVREP